MPSSSNTPTEAWWILGFIALGIIIFIKDYIRTIITVIIILILSSIILLIIYKIIRNIIKIREKYTSDKNHFLNKLKEIKKEDYSDSNKVKENIQEIKELEKDEFYSKFNKEINNIKKYLNNKYKKLKKEEINERRKLINERNREIRKQQQKELKEKQEVSKLLNYFKRKKSSKSIPDWALNYDEYITNKAVNDYKHIEWENNYKKEMWEEAKNFIQKHKAYPVNFNRMNKDEKNMYKKALKLLRKGKLKPEPKIHKQDKELFKRDFIYTKELEPEQRERFLKQYGYRHKKFLFLNGKPGNSLIIRNDPRKESDYHFCVKNMFYRMDKRAKIEYSIEGLRADVAFILDKKKIAVEIETGSNKEIQFKRKIEWLNRNFNYWIFVVSRQNENKFKKYVDNKKSFCLTLKKASEKVKEFLNGS